MEDEDDLAYRAHFGSTSESSESYDSDESDESTTNIIENHTSNNAKNKLNESDSDYTDESEECLRLPPVVYSPSQIVRIVANPSSNIEDKLTKNEESFGYEQSSPVTYSPSLNTNATAKGTSNLSDASKPISKSKCCETCGQILPNPITNSSSLDNACSKTSENLQTEEIKTPVPIKDFGIALSYFGSQNYVLQRAKTNANIITVSKVPHFQKKKVSFINRHSNLINPENLYKLDKSVIDDPLYLPSTPAEYLQQNVWAVTTANLLQQQTLTSEQRRTLKYIEDIQKKNATPQINSIESVPKSKSTKKQPSTNAQTSTKQAPQTTKINKSINLNKSKCQGPSPKATSKPAQISSDQHMQQNACASATTNLVPRQILSSKERRKLRAMEFTRKQMAAKQINSTITVKSSKLKQKQPLANAQLSNKSQQKTKMNVNLNTLKSQKPKAKPIQGPLQKSVSTFNLNTLSWPNLPSTSDGAPNPVPKPSKQSRKKANTSEANTTVTSVTNKAQQLLQKTNKVTATTINLSTLQLQNLTSKANTKKEMSLPSYSQNVEAKDNEKENKFDESCQKIQQDLNNKVGCVGQSELNINQPQVIKLSEKGWSDVCNLFASRDEKLMEEFPEMKISQKDIVQFPQKENKTDFPNEARISSSKNVSDINDGKCLTIREMNEVQEYNNVYTEKTMIDSKFANENSREFNNISFGNIEDNIDEEQCSNSIDFNSELFNEIYLQNTVDDSMPESDNKNQNCELVEESDTLKENETEHELHDECGQRDECSECDVNISRHDFVEQHELILENPYIIKLSKKNWINVANSFANRVDNLSQDFQGETKFEDTAEKKDIKQFTHNEIINDSTNNGRDSSSEDVFELNKDEKCLNVTKVDEVHNTVCEEELKHSNSENKTNVGLKPIAEFSNNDPEYLKKIDGLSQQYCMVFEYFTQLVEKDWMDVSSMVEESIKSKNDAQLVVENVPRLEPIDIKSPKVVEKCISAELTKKTDGKLITTRKRKKKKNKGNQEIHPVDTIFTEIRLEDSQQESLGVENIDETKTTLPIQKSKSSENSSLVSGEIVQNENLNKCDTTLKIGSSLATVLENDPSKTGVSPATVFENDQSHEETLKPQTCKNNIDEEQVLSENQLSDNQHSHEITSCQTNDVLKLNPSTEELLLINNSPKDKQKTSELHLDINKENESISFNPPLNKEVGTLCGEYRHTTNVELSSIPKEINFVNVSACLQLESIINYSLASQSSGNKHIGDTQVSLNNHNQPVQETIPVEPPKKKRKKKKKSASVAKVQLAEDDKKTGQTTESLGQDYDSNSCLPFMSKRNKSLDLLSSDNVHIQNQVLEAPTSATNNHQSPQGATSIKMQSNTSIQDIISDNTYVPTLASSEIIKEEKNVTSTKKIDVPLGNAKEAGGKTNFKQLYEEYSHPNLSCENFSPIGMFQESSARSSVEKEILESKFCGNCIDDKQDFQEHMSSTNNDQQVKETNDGFKMNTSIGELLVTENTCSSNLTNGEIVIQNLKKKQIATLPKIDVSSTLVNEKIEPEIFNQLLDYSLEPQSINSNNQPVQDSPTVHGNAVLTVYEDLTAFHNPHVLNSPCSKPVKKKKKRKKKSASIPKIDVALTEVDIETRQTKPLLGYDYGKSSSCLPLILNGKEALEQKSSDNLDIHEQVLEGTLVATNNHQSLQEVTSVKGQSDSSIREFILLDTTFVPTFESDETLKDGQANFKQRLHKECSEIILSCKNVIPVGMFEQSSTKSSQFYDKYVTDKQILQECTSSTNNSLPENGVTSVQRNDVSNINSSIDKLIVAENSKTISTNADIVKKKTNQNQITTFPKIDMASSHIDEEIGQAVFNQLLDNESTDGAKFEQSISSLEENKYSNYIPSIQLESEDNQSPSPELSDNHNNKYELLDNQTSIDLQNMLYTLSSEIRSFLKLHSAENKHVEYDQNVEVLPLYNEQFDVEKSASTFNLKTLPWPNLPSSSNGAPKSIARPSRRRRKKGKTTKENSLITSVTNEATKNVIQPLQKIENATAATVNLSVLEQSPTRSSEEKELLESQLCDNFTDQTPILQEHLSSTNKNRPLKEVTSIQGNDVLNSSSLINELIVSENLNSSSKNQIAAFAKVYVPCLDADEDSDQAKLNQLLDKSSDDEKFEHSSISPLEQKKYSNYSASMQLESEENESLCPELDDKFINDEYELLDNQTTFITDLQNDFYTLPSEDRALSKLPPSTENKPLYYERNVDEVLPIYNKQTDVQKSDSTFNLNTLSWPNLPSSSPKSISKPSRKSRKKGKTTEENSLITSVTNEAPKSVIQPLQKIEKATTTTVNLSMFEQSPTKSLDEKELLESQFRHNCIDHTRDLQDHMSLTNKNRPVKEVTTFQENDVLNSSSSFNELVLSEYSNSTVLGSDEIVKELMKKNQIATFAKIDVPSSDADEDFGQEIFNQLLDNKSTDEKNFEQSSLSSLEDNKYCNYIPSTQLESEDNESLGPELSVKHNDKYELLDNQTTLNTDLQIMFCTLPSDAENKHLEYNRNVEVLPIYNKQSDLQKTASTFNLNTLPWPNLPSSSDGAGKPISKPSRRSTKKGQTTKENTPVTDKTPKSAIKPLQKIKKATATTINVSMLQLPNLTSKANKGNEVMSLPLSSKSLQFESKENELQLCDKYNNDKDQLLDDQTRLITDLRSKFCTLPSEADSLLKFPLTDNNHLDDDRSVDEMVPIYNIKTDFKQCLKSSVTENTLVNYEQIKYESEQSHEQGKNEQLPILLEKGHVDDDKNNVDNLSSVLFNVDQILKSQSASSVLENSEAACVDNLEPPLVIEQSVEEVFIGKEHVNITSDSPIDLLQVDQSESSATLCSESNSQCNTLSSVLLDDSNSSSNYYSSHENLTDTETEINEYSLQSASRNGMSAKPDDFTVTHFETRADEWREKRHSFGQDRSTESNLKYFSGRSSEDIALSSNIPTSQDLLQCGIL